MTDLIGIGGAQVKVPAYATENLSESVVDSFSATPIEDGNSVPVILSRFAREESDTSDPRLIEGLEAMCRKLSVQRMVRTSYDEDWRVAVEKASLGNKWWPLMLFLLLSLPDPGDSDQNDARGIALKWVNAALVGIDVARGQGVGESTLSMLAELAEQRLDELTGKRN
jgi:hypothetical protein